MILRIDHIGLATDDAAGAAMVLRALNFGRAATGVAEAYQVNCDFWRIGGEMADGVDVEVVSPTGADSAVNGVLAQSGPGLYHLGLEVDDLEADLGRLVELGAVPLDREPCAGAKPGMRVGFVYFGPPLGLVVELVQYTRVTVDGDVPADAEVLPGYGVVIT